MSRDSQDDVRKGKSGGLFRKEADPYQYVGYTARPTAHIELKQMVDVPDPITGKVEDNYTCWCGNTKCNTTEKSCWKCGAVIKP